MAKNSSEVLAGRKTTRPDAGKSPYPPAQQGHDDKKLIRESVKIAREHQKNLDRIGHGNGYESDK